MEDYPCPGTRETRQTRVRPRRLPARHDQRRCDEEQSRSRRRRRRRKRRKRTRTRQTRRRHRNATPRPYCSGSCLIIGAGAVVARVVHRTVRFEPGVELLVFVVADCLADVAASLARRGAAAVDLTVHLRAGVHLTRPQIRVHAKFLRGCLLVRLVPHAASSQGPAHPFNNNKKNIRRISWCQRLERQEGRVRFLTNGGI